MRLRATSLLAMLALAAVTAQAAAIADEPATVPHAKQETPAPSPADARADIYSRLAAAKDSDQTEGLVGLLLHLYSQSGSDAGDLLLVRARKAMEAKAYPAAQTILDATIALLPDWAEGWNARATVRYLDDDYNGSMADIAETLKREPKHLGALMGMGAILEARGKREDALRVYEHALAIAPHWRNAEVPAERLKAALAGQEL